MDHWWAEAWGIADRFTPITPDTETFQVELKSEDDRAMRINGHRNILKRDQEQMVDERAIFLLGTQIAHTANQATGADLSVDAFTLGPYRLFKGEAAPEGTFWLELKTHGDRTMRVEGERTLLHRTQPSLVTDREVRQFGKQLLSTINTVTGEIELGGTAQV